MKKCLVLLSGGVDSSTALALAIRDFDEVIALSVSYGQKHERELKSAADIAKHYGVTLKTIDLNAVFSDSDCSLLANSEAEIPKESYAEQIKKTGGLTPVSTYIPFRNGLFISTAAAVALSNGCEAVLYGAHADDSAGNAYPDCSPEFFDAMNSALVTGSGGGIVLLAPFVKMNKADIVKLGLTLKVPYELTWSCYVGGIKPCGVCGTCIDRAGAFAAAGIEDPAM
ncbi:MAG: 7-cyano-7-deazaguanine synthase QueC [Ruminococcus sp.]|jgi:7-cyano-7-deazaguanine synthase|nr:7-cyano-7-deazaguanine synthase QueC [Ruminococcus sp.]